MQNWDDIRHFLTIVRTGSLQAAATELEVDQSTVFRRLRALERQLGTHLFDRRQRGRYQLTVAGENLIEQASRMEEAALDIDRRVRGQDLQLSGNIRVATAEDIAVTLLPCHLQAFEQAYPEISVELLTDNRYISLSRNEADVAIRPGFSSNEDRVIPRKICPTSFGLYAGEDYLSRLGVPENIEMLKYHRVIEWRKELTREHFTDEAFDWFGSAYRYGTNSLLTLRALAIAGLGVAILPEFVGNDDPRLQRILPEIKLDSGHIWLLHHDEVRHTARFQVFSEFMFNALKNDSRIPH
ncbi:MAG: LysR family transcriptional regulator [Pseudomonadota bacterium]